MPAGTAQTALRYEGRGRSLDYLRYVPDPGRWAPPWPLVLFLHGAGERGSDVDRVRAHGIPHVIERGARPPFVALSPQCPVGEWWTGVTATLRGLVEVTIAELPVDPDRVYLTGVSMGGYGAFQLAAETPDRWAALVPICGGGSPSWAPRLVDLPVWAFHGRDDDVVPVSETQVMVDALRKVGASVKLTLYDGVGHDAWTRTYDHPALYEWMLGQRRSPRGP